MDIDSQATRARLPLVIRAGRGSFETPGEVLAELHISLQSQGVVRAPTPPSASGTQAAPLDKAYEMLLDALGFEPVSINTLVERTGLPSASIASMLLILELGGRIAPYPGGRYCRLS